MSFKGWFLHKIESLSVTNNRAPEDVTRRVDVVPIEIHRKIRRMLQRRTGASAVRIEDIGGPVYKLVENAPPEWQVRGVLAWWDTPGEHTLMLDFSFTYYGDKEDDAIAKERRPSFRAKDAVRDGE